MIKLDELFIRGTDRNGKIIDYLIDKKSPTKPNPRPTGKPSAN